jgi:putative nucleotidyltransferase with HDIG domain
MTDNGDTKILLVDDEINITKALRRLLREVETYVIQTAHSGPEALELLAQEPDIGVIISDQRMPEMTGVEFLRQAREQAPDAVRMLLTGYADIDASIAAINEGAVFRYLSKPWQDNELLRTVAEAARAYQMVAENKRLNALVLKQKQELEEWNHRLKQRVLHQTSQIREKGDQLARSNQLLRQSFAATIEALAGLVEMRDQRAPAHSRNVAELVTAMAAQLSLSEAEQEQLRSAALLHDIGKIGMADRILNKATTELQGKEQQEYRDHVIRGQAAIDMVPELRAIGPLIRHHHERYDGGGFPDRLKGEVIPLGARLIAAADSFERQLTQFAENDALEGALAALDKHWGTSLDPELRTALERVAPELFSHLDISTSVREAKVSPTELRVGMQLRYDLHSGTGVLLLKQGTVFDEQGIEAVKRCFKIDPFEREIRVLLPTKNDQEG